ncbi:MAG: SsrA-binding protein SmpB [Candidatus Jacksonbacteria bacterium]|nr:SsrA-binding protein SmpB [Candidatus Jacksonbacteria bacterium]
MEIVNKHASRLYEVIKRIKVGIKLTGGEVKSCKAGRINFTGAYCAFSPITARLTLRNFYIAPYAPAKREQRGYDPYRERTLLLKKQELIFISGKAKEKGIAIVPLKIYTDRRLVKCEIGIARGLKKYDKREKLKKEEFARRKQRIVSR